MVDHGGGGGVPDFITGGGVAAATAAAMGWRQSYQNGGIDSYYRHGDGDISGSSYRQSIRVTPSHSRVHYRKRRHFPSLVYGPIIASIRLKKKLMASTATSRSGAMTSTMTSITAIMPPDIVLLPAGGIWIVVDLRFRTYYEDRLSCAEARLIVRQRYNRGER
jgi:hypothetical protein